VRNVIWVGCLILASTTAAAAQNWEVGGSMAVACIGSDGSICDNNAGPLVGAHVSRWFDDRIEIAGRWSRVGVPSFDGRTVYPVETRYSVTDRSREFVSALFIYHFLHEARIRPMVGGGTGLYGQAQRVTCEPFRCSDVPGLPPEGPHREWMEDIIVVAGLSGTAHPRLVWQAGWMAHRFANDHNSTTEFFFSVGYRFGRR
jgi:hypothetical protein